MHHKIKLFFVVNILCCLSNAWSESGVDDATVLAKKSQNPVENMISVPINSNFNLGYGENGNTQYILDVKPVIPFSLNHDWNLISRMIIPLIHQPDIIPSKGYRNGLGDLNPTLYLSPANPGMIIWGIGPTAILPTATNNQMGAGKYSLGPSFVILAMPKQWVLGILTFNVWSLGGQSSRENVNAFQFQYFINYNFPHGWYVNSAPTITADWYASKSDRWIIPFGLGVGHVFKIGAQDVNAGVQAYNNVKTPKNGGPDWQLQANVTLLFPG